MNFDCLITVTQLASKAEFLTLVNIKCTHFQLQRAMLSTLIRKNVNTDVFIPILMLLIPQTIKKL